MRINQVEKCTGMTKKSIRFYEEHGLVKPKRNRENDYREYDQEDLERLKTIRLLRLMSIPVETIGEILNGSITIQEAMDTQIRELTRREKEIANIRELCIKVSSENYSIEEIRPDTYLNEIEKMKEQGTKFPEMDQFNKRMIKGSVIAAVCFSVFMLALTIVMVYLWLSNKLPLAIMIIIVVAMVAPLIGALVGLKQRIKEIKGGEDYEASKY